MNDILIPVGLALRSLLLTALVSSFVFAAEVPSARLLSLSDSNAGQLDAGSGYSVAMDGKFAIVGAPYEDWEDTDTGVVRVYNATNGMLLRTLVNPAFVDPFVFYWDYFGYAVAVSGTRLVVGVPNAGNDPVFVGKAYVYNLGSTAPD